MGEIFTRASRAASEELKANRFKAMLAESKLQTASIARVLGISVEKYHEIAYENPNATRVIVEVAQILHEAGEAVTYEWGKQILEGALATHYGQGNLSKSLMTIKSGGPGIDCEKLVHQMVQWHHDYNSREPADRYAD